MLMQLVKWLFGLLGGTTPKKLMNIAIIVLTVCLFLYVKNLGFKDGVSVTTSKYEKALTKAVDEAVQKADKKNEANKSIAQAYWENELAKKPKIETIEKRIIEYVEIQIASDADECLLDDGELFILQDLVTIANSTTKDTDRYGTNATVQQDSPTNQTN